MQTHECQSMKDIFTREEKIEMLQEYMESLEEEASQIAELIRKLRSNN